MEGHFPNGEQIIDHLEPEGNNEQNQLLQEWQDADPRNKSDWNKYSKIWNSSADINKLNQFKTQKAWVSVDAKISQHAVRIKKLKNLGYLVSGMAASLILVLAFSFYTDLFSGDAANLSLSTAYGSRSEIVLPDGSHVNLNAGSSLEYRYNRLKKTREVNFSGEAFFEVARSKNPFVIHTPEGLNVKVLGTKFNLSAYPEDTHIQTSLVEGKVELTHAGADGFILNTGQIVAYNKKLNTMNLTNGEITHQVGWIQHKLYMDNMSLSDVCKKLERWYDVRISLSKTEIGDKIHYTGVLSEQTVKDVLDALSRLSAISYQIKGKEIVISES